MFDTYSINNVADWFLNKESMTPKKLQKLAYYAQAWANALLDRHPIETDFEAWAHGPVSPQLYNEYKHYGWNDIPKLENDNSEIFDEKFLDILESVWLTYGDKDGNELEAITHREMPWSKARGGLDEGERCQNVISNSDMRDFYISIYNGD